MKLNQIDMDRIIDTYWPKTRSRNSLYKMLQDASNLAEKALLAYEETQEPVASYQLSAPVQQTGDVREAWEYSFTHSSATGKGDTNVGPCLTYDRSIAYGVGCFNQREVAILAASGGAHAVPEAAPLPAEQPSNPVALDEKPIAYMRKWAFDGEKPVKSKNAAGRISWGKFKLLPVTQGKCQQDDIPLVARIVGQQTKGGGNARQPVAVSVDTPEFRAVLSIYNQGRMTENDFICHINTHINAHIITPAAPSVTTMTHFDCMRELQDHWISEEECNSVDFDAIYGRYSLPEIRAELAKRRLTPAAPSQAPVAYAESGVLHWMTGRRFDNCELYTHPAPRDVDAPIVLPEKPKSNLITETSGPDPMCSYIDTAYTGDQMDAHATAAVQKDRADQKGQTK